MKEQTAKFKQDRVMTAIVGSYPKPKSIFNRSGRELLNEDGHTFYELEEIIGAQEFKKRLDVAARMAIDDQNAAGIDLITDGEQRRSHYVYCVIRKLGGISFEHRTEKTIRDGRYVRHVPTVVGKITYQGSILIADYQFTAQHAQGIPKIGLPGPSTVVDSLDYAAAIRHEVSNLLEAGCQVIQFDDPVLLRYPDQTQKWGLKALQACFEGFEDRATFFVHICRGYPDKPLERKGIEYKANADYYVDILDWLSQSSIDVVSIEGAQSNLDLSVLPAIGEKTVMLGVLDVGSNVVESVKSLIERGKDALRHLPKEQLILAPDCGMLQLSQAAARNKLINLAEAASILNGL
jgi:5-methyltetrahydropteroyltriglutamate--homocysteine methyltransferase